MRRAMILLLLCTLQPLGAGTSAQGESPGHVAWIDLDYNVWRLDVGRDSHLRLTGDGGANKRYLWPTWSNDGRLAWFSHEVVDGALVTEAWVQPEAGALASRRYRGDEAFNYAYWSPGNCLAGADCRHLAILLSSNARGMFVELVQDGQAAAVEGLSLRGGPPFYFSWSPDGGRLLLQRNNRRFDVYDANQDRLLATLDVVPGKIQAPHWSPVDERLLLGLRRPDGRSALVVLDDGDRIVLADELEGAPAFNWSPDGRLVAWREQNERGYGPLLIADAATGQPVAASPEGGALAFVWAPDGQRIAWLALVPQGRNISADRRNNLLAQSRSPIPGMRWWLLEVDSARLQISAPFFPTQEMLYYISYFDQFAQSHRLWSPDSRYLVYGELGERGPLVQLLDADNLDDGPRTLAPGRIGIWDFGAS